MHSFSSSGRRIKNTTGKAISFRMVSLCEPFTLTHLLSSFLLGRTLTDSRRRPEKDWARTENGKSSECKKKDRKTNLMEKKNRSCLIMSKRSVLLWSEARNTRNDPAQERDESSKNGQSSDPPNHHLKYIYIFFI